MVKGFISLSMYYFLTPIKHFNEKQQNKKELFDILFSASLANIYTSSR